MAFIESNTPFGPYHIVRTIGGGGMAQIYLAKTSGLAGFEKHLALKVINPEYADEDRFIRMLIDEAKITVGLTHVNIAQVFDLGQVNGVYYIAMEYVDGPDLLELVNSLHAQGQRLPIASVAYIGREICSGLDYAHNRKDSHGNPLNTVHRDISPQNVLVSRNGEVKIVDFGIAKAAGMSAKTQAGVIKGKVNYMSPEQAAGQKADRRTDVFAAGIVMWEMLTSQMAYNGDNVGELVALVRKGDIPPPSSVRPEVPGQLDAILAKALAKDPTERYQTASQLQTALTRFLSATAGDFSAPSLARLIERIVDSKEEAPAIQRTLSREDLDQLSQRHSLVFRAPTATGPAKLTVHTDQGQEVVDLRPDEKELMIGRAADLVVADARVSRQHARISSQNGAYTIEDLGSSNGTYVNKKRLRVPHILAEDDEIRIGNARIVFSWATPDSRITPAKITPKPIAKLLIETADRHLEQHLDGDTELTYRVRIGTLELSGTAGTLTFRKDGYWLEPSATGRMPITHNGERALLPVRMSLNEKFQIGEVTFRLAHETRPFDAVKERN